MADGIILMKGDMKSCVENITAVRQIFSEPPRMSVLLSGEITGWWTRHLMDEENEAGDVQLKLHS